MNIKERGVIIDTDGSPIRKITVGDRVIINTGGRLKWADRNMATIKEFNDPNLVVVQIDDMDTKIPPYGLATVFDYEIRPIETTEEAPKTDPVNHPSHYTDGKYECIDYMEGRGYTQDGYLFNAVKYISRAGKKDPDKYEEDIQKAIWYLKRKIEKIGTVSKGIPTKDYIEDKGLEGTLPGIALELIDDRNYKLAAKVLQMELDTHNKHSS